MTEGQAALSPVTPGWDDLPSMRQLLTLVSLPLASLEAQFPDAFVVCRGGGGIVGMAGLERHGSAGLLRSVAVLPSQRGTGVGRQLVHNRLQHARELGLRDVFLLTTTASGYFSRFGFTLTERASAPALLLESPEFAGVCPSSAACFVWHP